MTLPAFAGFRHPFAVVRVMNNSAGFRFPPAVVVRQVFPDDRKWLVVHRPKSQNGTILISGVSISEDEDALKRPASRAYSEL
jgi:hypothetical protein